MTDQQILVATMDEVIQGPPISTEEIISRLIKRGLTPERAMVAMRLRRSLGDAIVHQAEDLHLLGRLIGEFEERPTADEAAIAEVLQDVLDRLWHSRFCHQIIERAQQKGKTRREVLAILQEEFTNRAMLRQELFRLYQNPTPDADTVKRMEEFIEQQGEHEWVTPLKDQP